MESVYIFNHIFPAWVDHIAFVIKFSLDIDECAEGTDRCAQNCHNTIGSYTCSCNVGYRLNTNGYDCDGKPDEVIKTVY